MRTIYIKDFTKFPGPRYAELGAYSGEEFRDTILYPAFITEDSISVNFDGVFGYGSSFLEESFGGLVRKGVPINKMLDLKNNLQGSNSSILEEVRAYIDEAINEANHGK